MKNDVPLVTRQHGTISRREVDQKLRQTNLAERPPKLDWWERMLIFLAWASPIK